MCAHSAENPPWKLSHWLQSQKAICGCINKYGSIVSGSICVSIILHTGSPSRIPFVPSISFIQEPCNINIIQAYSPKNSAIHKQNILRLIFNLKKKLNEKWKCLLYCSTQHEKGFRKSRHFLSSDPPLLPFHYDMLRVTAVLLHWAANKHIIFHQDPAQWLQWHYW